MAKNLTRNFETAKKYGVHEISLETQSGFGNPYLDVDFNIIFYDPAGNRIKTEGFYDGKNIFKARAYCNKVGKWKWESRSSHSDLHNKSGDFQVVHSSLKGKLKINKKDPYQLQYDNGDWFLHLGDTGYRYLAAEEAYWKEYLEQAAASGITKIRTWFCQGRSDIQALFGRGDKKERNRLNLNCWQEMDRRLIYGLNNYPDIIFQLIVFGEDGDEIRRYGERNIISRLITKYAQARFSAFPNIYWTISNDHKILENDNGELEPGLKKEGVPLARKEDINEIGEDMAEQEPWKTLLTNHQSRFTGFSFLNCDWADLVTLEDLGQVTGEKILEYRKKGRKPVILDEDRYETHRSPENDRYFFRRLMWGVLLSGGHPTYGGLETYEYFDGDKRGLYGYYDACREGKLEQGAHDFQYIHKFFEDTGINLINMVPADEITGNRPLLYKVIGGKSQDRYIIYLANPDEYTGHNPDGFAGNYTDKYADVSREVPQVKVDIDISSYKIDWYQPFTGKWFENEKIKDDKSGNILKAPGQGDWIVYLRR
ncbi:MAG: DUF4038 domain-containing protein [bacterium]